MDMAPVPLTLGLFHCGGVIGFVDIPCNFLKYIYIVCNEIVFDFKIIIKAIKEKIYCSWMDHFQWRSQENISVGRVFFKFSLLIGYCFYSVKSNKHHLEKKCLLKTFREESNDFHFMIFVKIWTSNAYI